MGPHDLTEDLDAEPASGVVLSELLDAQKPGSALEYEYDFGDGWTHHVEVLGSADLPAGELLCVDGANRGPVEDSGGPHGYTRMLQIVADPEHPEHADAPCWPPGLSPAPAIPPGRVGQRHHRVVRWNFECLHLTALKVGPLDRALLTDGGMKFRLAVQAVGRSV